MITVTVFLGIGLIFYTIDKTIIDLTQNGDILRLG